MTRALRSVLCLNDFEPLARRKLPKPIYAYVSGAVEDNASARANRDAFARYTFVPRMLRNVSARSTEVELFGQRYSAPVGIAPMGISALSAYDGDRVLALAGGEANVPVIMSGSSLTRVEDVMKVAPRTWFQAYLPGQIDQIRALIERVGRAGVQTLVITVDTPVAANRENNVRAGFSTPLRPSLGLAWQGISHPRWLFGTFLQTILRRGMPHFENNYATRGAPILSGNVLRDFADRAHLDWSHLEQIRAMWPGTLIVKGILHPDDARRARDIGVQGVIVSNHGGRQLDGAVSPLRMLPAIVAAVGQDVTVMLDSGVRRGTDVVKALALGARCVFVGRPFNYAATIAGQPGVAHGIRLIKQELSCDMGMLGVTRIEDIGPQVLGPSEVIDPFDSLEQGGRSFQTD